MQINKDFTSDKEKMQDFAMLTKEAFLKMYSYLTEAEYQSTYFKVFGHCGHNFVGTCKHCDYPF